MAPSKAQRGVNRAPFLDDEQIESLDLSDHNDRLLLAIHQASTEKLKYSYFKMLVKEDEHSKAWLLSDALQSRGIAPCFYGIPTEKELWQSSDTDFILMVTDLQWIVSTYPKHEPEWKRLKALWVADSNSFMKVAEYLFWDGRRTAGQIAKALNLTEQQQRECNFIQGLNVKRWRQRLEQRYSIAQIRISSNVHDKDRRNIEERKLTIKRRTDLWLSAEIANWKPQLTADYYTMITGEVLPRNVVSNQLAKLPKVRRAEHI